mmetsp:Transcript_16119/g.15473  ORF Transcript_16119/g.15473 Transcript_16119/m.15473 type:complete len:186 (+) Transcript_16119:459-1016(+)
MPGKGAALTATTIVADDVNPPSPVVVSVKARGDPGDKELALIINSTELRPTGNICVIGDRETPVNTTDVSLTVHTEVPVVCKVTKPDSNNLFSGFSLLMRVVETSTKGSSPAFTTMVTVLVTVRVVSYTVTVRALVVSAVLAVSVSVDVLNELGRATPQVLDTTGAVCVHVHMNDKPACTPNIPG